MERINTDKCHSTGQQYMKKRSGQLKGSFFSHDYCNKSYAPKRKRIKEMGPAIFIQIQNEIQKHRTQGFRLDQAAYPQAILIRARNKNI
jgi:hypothetical protein